MVLARRAVADYPLHADIMAQLLHQSPTLESRFQTIASPALIVWGTEDKVLNPQGASALQALLPDSRVALMQGIGHVPMMEAHKATAAEYLRFRGELQPGAA
jgi:pimeloyl-ACP methyl ester carboxylesterase